MAWIDRVKDTATSAVWWRRVTVMRRVKKSGDQAKALKATEAFSARLKTAK